MDKITRTYFSFNTGKAPAQPVKGWAGSHAIKKNGQWMRSWSLEDGAVKYWESSTGNTSFCASPGIFPLWGSCGAGDFGWNSLMIKERQFLYYGVERMK